jgi:hypothetical protein
MIELWGYFVDWWHGFGGETKAAIIQGVSTVAAATLGAWAISKQIRKQAEQSRRQVIQTEGRRLKSLFYEEVARTCAAESETNLAYTSWLRQLQMEISLYESCSQKGLVAPGFSKQIPEFLHLQTGIQNGAIEVIFLIERRLIFDPRIDVFRMAINVALHDLREGHHKLFLALTPVLPADLPDGTRHPGVPPSIYDVAKIVGMIDQQLDAALNLGSWLSDFLVVMQNELLGDVFDAKVPLRVPLNPNDIVITLDKAREVEAYFEDQTDWGANKRRVEQQVKQKYANLDAAG